MKENPDELVWIDPGDGPVRALYGNQGGRTIFMHEPKQVKRKDVELGCTILSEQMLAIYRSSIAAVDRRKADKQKDK